jgi:hypothetical protein
MRHAFLILSYDLRQTASGCDKRIIDRLPIVEKSISADVPVCRIYKIVGRTSSGDNFVTNSNLEDRDPNSVTAVNAGKSAAISAFLPLVLFLLAILW